MAGLGAPKTGKFIIGTFEVRVGPQSSAGKLLQSHSIGVIDSFTLDMQQESVDLMAGFPQEPVDTAITRQISGLTCAMREYSVRNLNILLGNGVPTNPSHEYRGYVDTDTEVDTGIAYAKYSTSIKLVHNQSAPEVGDTLVISKVGDPAAVYVIQVETYTTPGGVPTITFTPELPEALVYDTSNTTYLVHEPAALAFGKQSAINYFAVSLVQIDRATSRPLVWDFWKAALETGMDLNSTGNEFATAELKLKFLEPTAAEYATTYSQVYSEFTKFPVGRYAAVQDVL